VSTLETAVGTATVLHRMALAVEVLDAVTGQRVRSNLRIDREVDPLFLAPGHRDVPLAPLTPRDPGRALILFDHTVPTVPVRLRIWDPARRHAPRRLDLPLWTLAEIEAAEVGPPEIRAASRVLRPHLHPGTAWPSPRGTTVIRGRVESGGAPVRWARVSAVRTGDMPIGHGHADDRGEFFVVLLDTGTLPPPTPSTLSVDLLVTAPDPATAAAVDGRDPLADLVVEPVARSSSPPSPAELDNDLLRGLATPAGYVPNTAAVPTLVVPTGTELVLTQPIPFAA
jgi:hypothetical protein